MADLDQLATAIATNLAAVTGIQISSHLLSNPTPPSAEIVVGETDYDLTMQRGGDKIIFTVRGFVSFTSDIGSSTLLRTWMATTGSSSFKAAIESDRTLGGHAATLRVTKCSGEKGFLREVHGTAGRGSAQGPLLGAEWTVEVLT